jgi:hypothetical protein
MANIREILKARGLDDANIETLVTNPAYASVLEGFVNEAESGKTALLKAQQLQQELKDWNEKTLIPTYTKKDQEYAVKDAEIAKKDSYLKSLKAQGYEVPDAWIDGSAASAPVRVEPSAPKDYAADIVNMGLTNLEVISISNKYRKLVGDELDPQAEYEKLKKEGRPGETLRAFIDRTYDLPGKQAAKTAEAEQKKMDEYAATKVTAAQAEWNKKHGENGETRVPQSTKHDRFRTIAEEKKNNWNTTAGREAATIARQEKYGDVLSKRQVAGSVN